MRANNLFAILLLEKYHILFMSIFSSVVVDRRFDKNCDIGAFELAFKQPVVNVPPYIGINLCVEGQPIRRPQGLQPRSSIAPTSDVLFTPRTVTMRHTNADRSPLKNSNSQGLFGGSNSVGPNLENASLGSNQNHHHAGRKENRASTPEAISSSKSLVGKHQPREIAAKVGSFRSAPGHSEKMKFNLKGNVGNTDQSESGDGATFSPGKQIKNSDSSKKVLDSCTIGSVLDPANPGSSNPAIPRIGDGMGATDLAIHNGPPSGSMRVLPNTPYLAGLNQRRYISKTSVSNNYTIPAGPNSDRGGPVGSIKSSSSRTLAVNNVESTDLQTFKPSSHTKGNQSGQNNLHLVAFPPTSRLLRRRSIRGGNKKKKKKSSRGSMSNFLPSQQEPGSLTFQLPKVPYASISVDHGGESSAPTIPSMPTKLKYFNRSADSLYNLNNYTVVGASDRL